MNCSCHDSPMYFNKDKRCTTSGGFWECRERRRERNALRLKAFGTTIYTPDDNFKRFALCLREERKRGRTDD